MVPIVQLAPAYPIFDLYPAQYPHLVIYPPRAAENEPPRRRKISELSRKKGGSLTRKTSGRTAAGAAKMEEGEGILLRRKVSVKREPAPPIPPMPNSSASSFTNLVPLTATRKTRKTHKELHDWVFASMSPNASLATPSIKDHDLDSSQSNTYPHLFSPIPSRIPVPVQRHRSLRDTRSKGQVSSVEVARLKRKVSLPTDPTGQWDSASAAAAALEAFAIARGLQGTSDDASPRRRKTSNASIESASSARRKASVSSVVVRDDTFEPELPIVRPLNLTRSSSRSRDRLGQQLSEFPMPPVDSP